MVEMTPEAGQALNNVMVEQNLKSPIRIFMQSGCGGSQLAMGVDEARDGDEQFTVDGLDFVIEKDLAEVVGDIKLDFIDEELRKGFMLTSSNPLPQAASCGSTCGDGCCGC